MYPKAWQLNDYRHRKLESQDCQGNSISRVMRFVRHYCIILYGQWASHCAILIMVNAGRWTHACKMVLMKISIRDRSANIDQVLSIDHKTSSQSKRASTVWNLGLMLIPVMIKCPRMETLKIQDCWSWNMSISHQLHLKIIFMFSYSVNPLLWFLPICDFVIKARVWDANPSSIFSVITMTS